ncbi:kinase-like protein, partial [Rickenella mellea]
KAIGLQAMIKELKIWSRLDHQNILRLWGYTLDDEECPALISEWMTNGTVLSYLKLNPQVDLLDLVKGIADGLAYLHKEGVVHGDLKSDDVLISPSGVPLLTDFGISRAMVLTHTVTWSRELMGSVRWMAYELIAPQESGPQKITDVWAFGMVVYV